MTKKKKSQAKRRVVRFELYADKAGRWRWRMKAGNGRNIARSSEGDGWKHLSGATKNLAAMFGALGLSLDLPLLEPGLATRTAINGQPVEIRVLRKAADQ